MNAVSRTRAELGHPADVVAAEVHQHEVLGALLGVGRQLLGERRVLLRRRAARAGAGDRADVTSPSSTRTRISGELPMTCMSSQCR